MKLGDTIFFGVHKGSSSSGYYRDQAWRERYVNRVTRGTIIEINSKQIVLTDQYGNRWSFQRIVRMDQPFKKEQECRDWLKYPLPSYDKEGHGM